MFFCGEIRKLSNLLLIGKKWLIWSSDHSFCCFRYERARIWVCSSQRCHTKTEDLATQRTFQHVSLLIRYTFCHTCFSTGDLGMQVSILSSIHQHLPWCLASTTPHTVLYRSFIIFSLSFLHGMRMCMWFGYNCKIIVCTFSTLWT